MQTLQDHIFHILQYFATKLHNCMKFRMLFPAVLIDFQNSKVCLIGEWSIHLHFACAPFIISIRQNYLPISSSLILVKAGYYKLLFEGLCHCGFYLDLLPKFVSDSQVIFGPQDVVLWCRAVRLQHFDRSWQRWSTSGRIFLQGISLFVLRYTSRDKKPIWRRNTSLLFYARYLVS